MGEAKIHWPTDGGESLRQVTSFPVGITNDSAYGYEFDALDGQGVKKRVRTKKGMISSEEQGIFGNGSDMTSQINAAFAKTKVLSVEMEVPGGGAITVNGTVTIPAGKLLKFLPGTYLTGTGTINGGIIEAGDWHQIFGGSLIVNPQGFVRGYASAKWWGAAGDGIADDAVSLQKGIDCICRNAGVGRTLKFPRGTYKISAPLIAYYFTTTYQFVNIEMIGEQAAAFTNTPFNTVIMPTFTDKFAMGIQRGKSCKIKGFYFSGPADGVWADDWPTFVARPYNGFMQGLARESAQSPMCGIIIDPFTNGQIPLDGGYPGMTSWYHGDNNNGGSSNIVVEDCKIYGFTVCVGLSINGYTFNCESCNFNNIAISYCQTGFACGTDQLKDNHIKGLICWYYCHTVLSNSHHGLGYGNIPFVDGLDIAGIVNRLVDYADSGRYPVYFKNIFTEGLFQIGNINGAQLSVIETSDLDFATAINTNTPSPNSFFTGSNVVFRNCNMRIYDNTLKRLFFQCDNVTFEGCTFQNLPVTRVTNISGLQKAIFKNCKLTIPITIAGPGNFLTQFGHSDRVVLGTNFTVQDADGYAYGPVNRFYNDPIAEGLFRVYTQTVTVDHTTATATYTEADITGFWFKGLKVNEYLITNDGVYAVRISAINTSTGLVTLSEVPISMNTGSYYFLCNYVRYNWVPFIGDIIAGNTTISNIDAFRDDFAEVGCRLESNAFDPGAYIMSVNVGARTAVVSSPAIFTKTAAQFAPGNPSQTVYSIVPPAFINAFMLAGTDFVLKDDTSSSVRDQHYIFSKGGYTVATGGQHQAAWRLAADLSATGLNQLSWFDPFDNTTKVVNQGGTTPIVVTATDANSTMAFDTDLEILPTITASRTLTLPSAASLTGKIRRIWNQNSTSFNWTFASAITLPDNTTATAIPNDTITTIQSDGTVWFRVDSIPTVVNPVVITATDANATMASDTDTEILPDITANRVLTLPAASGLTGKVRRILNKNSTGFTWTFSAGITLPDDTTSTAILNDAPITIQSDGVVWRRVDGSVISHDSTLSGTGSSSGDPIFFKGVKNYTQTQINALTGKNNGDLVFNTTIAKLQWWDAGTSVWYTLTNVPVIATATDANTTVAGPTGLQILPVVTANRTLTLPAAASYPGQVMRLWNKNNSMTYSWTFAAAITLGDGSTTTTFPNGKIMELESDGTVWVQTNSSYDPNVFYRDSTLGGSGSTSGDPVYVKGLRSFTTTARNALTGMNGGDAIFNSTTNRINYWNGSSWRELTDVAA